MLAEFQGRRTGRAGSSTETVDKNETMKQEKMKTKHKKNENLQNMIQKIRIKNKLAMYKFTPKFTTEDNTTNSWNLHVKFEQFKNVMFVVKTPVDVIVDDIPQVGFNNLQHNQEHQVEQQQVDEQQEQHTFEQQQH